MLNHVEFLVEFCGDCCTDTYHCVTCHRNNELRAILDIRKIVTEFHQVFQAIGSNPMLAGMMGGNGGPKLPPFPTTSFIPGKQR